MAAGTKKVRAYHVFSKTEMLLFVLVFALIGGFVLLESFAAPPPTVFYVDPSNGSDTGDGSAQKPWKTLANVIAAGKIESQDKNGAISNPKGPVKPGDTILLRSGYHGSIMINGYSNSSPITVAAASGSTPQIKDLELNGSSNWVFRGLSISSSYDTSTGLREGKLVRIGINGNFFGNTSHITLENSQIFTTTDTAGWTANDWATRTVNGIADSGSYDIMRNNLIKNVNYGLVLSGSYSVADSNTVENFVGDGTRGTGNYETFLHNTVKDLYKVNDDHNDGFQSWSVGADGKVGTGTVYGNKLIGNKFINYTDPNRPYKGTMQGIGCFDGMYDGWVVENNLVVTDHWHGITFGGLLNSKVINNTVVDQNTVTPGPPWILIGKHKNGTPGANDIVRNNLAEGGVSIAGGQSNITSDHNTKLSHTDLAKYFVNPYDPLNYDFHLKTGSPAIDAGIATDAPTGDIDDGARPYGRAFDQGAYEFGAIPSTAVVPVSAPNPPTSTGGNSKVTQGSPNKLGTPTSSSGSSSAKPGAAAGTTGQKTSSPAAGSAGTPAAQGTKKDTGSLGLSSDSVAKKANKPATIVLSVISASSALSAVYFIWRRFV